MCVRKCTMVMRKDIGAAGLTLVVARQVTVLWRKVAVPLRNAVVAFGKVRLTIGKSVLPFGRWTSAVGKAIRAGTDRLPDRANDLPQWERSLPPCASGPPTAP